MRILEYLKNNAIKDNARFHMPGHKGKNLFDESFFSFDITEISGADNLLNPDGIIKKAQDSAAEFFGARSTFFSTCGATTAVQAALFSIPQDYVILVARDCHKSVVSSLALSGHDAHLIDLDYDCELELNRLIDVRLIKQNVESIIKNNKKMALVITRPDYFGRCADIHTISEYCKKNDVLLIVDEAHGSHFAFSDKLPVTASNYADMWVNSAHKTLNVPNQGAYLHLGKKAMSISPDDIAFKLSLIHTTSPSYPILAALDEAWRNKNQTWKEHIDKVNTWVKTLPDFWQNALCILNKDGVQNDATRLCFDICEYDARIVAKQLEDYGIHLEMCDHRRLVAITTPSDIDQWYNRLKDALLNAELIKRSGHSISIKHNKPKRIVAFRDAVFSRTKRSWIEKAIGKVAASSVGLYPPGSAIIAPGELIEEKVVKHLIEQKKNGAELFGENVMIIDDVI